MARPSRVVASVTAAALVALVGYVALDAADVVPGVVTAAPVATPTSTTTSTASPATTPTGDDAPPTSSAAPTADPAVVPTSPPLPGLSPSAPMPDPGVLAATLTPLLAAPALGPGASISVRDAATDTPLLGVRATRPGAPASSTKVVTAAAVVAGSSPTDRFTTRVVEGPASAGNRVVVLVAGGDNLLATGAGTPGAVAGRAGLADLAAGVARSLRAGDGPAGQSSPAASPTASSSSTPTAPARRVTVVLDDRHARGPALAPGWAPGDVAVGITGPVAMLGLATDRAIPGRPASADPAMRAAAAFRAALAAALARHGVAVAPAVARGAAPAGAATLASVDSAPVVDVLALALDESDNDLTESVARWACARNGAPVTFAGCAGWVRSRAVALGLPQAGLRLLDTSGLTRGTTVPADTLARTVTLATTGAEPNLARVLARSPVAGLSGTLADRYRSGPSRAGAGVVRAKTGTLTGVSTLTGTVVSKDGRLLAFSIVADSAPPSGTLAARAALDRVATTLAACGCRSAG
ncbi:D-alanyl-D-alanine carboxypeptidase [Agilicoccus flavus]|uniref:D-alanyl-D-alanine carboxypeptidase n=1 Tax=Agilicoccus flavus TaxID=2775968 RepID=UPI001CF64AC5|nr:D-alanyl-D-alanine carboxypeptidase [Agilicoccus flavus]